jgi:hypothetical protein
MERNRHKLNTNKSQNSVNKDGYQPLSLNSDGKLLPYNDITRVINENEVFNNERQSSTKYRIVTSINSLLCNPLFNISGDNSWETFNTPLFRDRSYPPNGISLNEEEDLTFFESVDFHLKEKNGWFGYYNPKVNESNRFLFQDMKPGREELEIITKDDSNWDITYTYPADKLNNELTTDGLDIISKKEVNVGGKKMVAIGIPYKHNLKLGDIARLKNIGLDGDYEVKRLGLDNGDLKSNYFCIDVDIEQLTFNKPKFKKIVNGEECSYYFRVFKRLNNYKGEVLSDLDYDVYPVAFSKNVFGDPMIQVATKNDIDIDGLTDNLGRPLTEIYLTYIKKSNKGFTDVSSGLLVNNVPGLENNKQIPDIKRIHNGVDKPFKSSDTLNDAVLFSDESYIGDLVEYNEQTLLETILSETHHRFNTINRETGKQIKTVINKSETSAFDTNEGSAPIEEIVEYLNSVDLIMGTNQMGSSGFKSYEAQDSSRTKSSRLRTIDGDDFGYEGSGFEYGPINLKYDKSNSNICDESSERRQYSNDPSLSSATQIFTDRNGYNKSEPGYYSDGVVVKYWTGTRFTSSSNCSGNVNNGNNDSGSDSGTYTETFDLGARQEGYYYKPFHKIKIREFSNYVEFGDEKTVGVPSYATETKNGKLVWRDILDIGINNEDGGLDYPFLNGVHHLYIDNILSLKRQDPFSKIGLRAVGDIGDVKGIELSEKHKIKRTGDVC